MSANLCAERSHLSETALWRLLAQENHSMMHDSAAGATAPRAMAKPVYLKNAISCLSLWISLLAAIWFVRGWIGLFLSGQVLSAGACLLQILTRRTCHAFSASK